MTARLDKVIAALARKQHGYLTRRQLLDIGLSSDEIKYRVRSGSLIPVYAGVYAVGHLPLAPEARAHAAVLACGDGAILSHGSAAALWKYVRHWPPRFEVIATWDRRRRGIKVHRTKTLTRRDTTRQLGVPVTSPARTVFDMTPRLKTDGALRRFVNDARLTRTFHLSDLAELLERHPRHPATKRLTQFLDPRAGGPTRSEFEDAFTDFAREYGLPTPITNTRLLGFEIDALFPEHRLIVELDGAEFHLDRYAFESDRDRDAELLAAGYVTVRITWERLKFQPAREADRLRRILRNRAREAA
jgi:predicted transcriptional regulator of viral defense system